MTDYLTEAQREVDEMLPGTPRIGPEPPLEIPGCVVVPANWRWADEPPHLRSRWSTIEFFRLAAIGASVGLLLWRLASLSAVHEADVNRLESIRDDIWRMRVDAAIARSRVDNIDDRLHDSRAQIRALEEAARRKR